MKIGLLAEAFRRFAGGDAEAVTPSPATAAPTPSAPASPEGRAEHEQDTVTVSAEALFRFVADRFDPRRITRRDAHMMVDILRDGGAISPDEYETLSQALARRPETPRTEDGTRDLVGELQDRLARAMGRGDVAAVAAHGRALSIVGRLSGLRQERTGG